MRPPRDAEIVEMIDGRIYWSRDGWQTVWLTKRDGETRVVHGRQADLARFLAIAQASASA